MQMAFIYIAPSQEHSPLLREKPVNKKRNSLQTRENRMALTAGNSHSS